jgi:integrase
VEGASAEVTQRIYRNKVDTPKTHQSVRKAALTEGLIEDLELWKSTARESTGTPFVFASGRGTALSKDNVWRRNMLPSLAKAGLGWANFQVMRRTHASLMRSMKEDPHAVAAQLGHTVDVSLNVYSQSPVEARRDMVNRLEKLVIE